MLEIRCSGSPYEIGLQHGRAAHAQIESCLAFYAAFFRLRTGMDWTATTVAARKFMPLLLADWPHFVDEMQGIADGAEVPFDSILALNVRTEISMGMMTDGCTSLAWKTPDTCYLAQTWDWEPEQETNLVVLHIKRDPTATAGLPSISQVTEAGIIGKIGINAAGVGVCLNAVPIRGVDFARLPCHLALRAFLDSTSRTAALATLEKAGVAAACHIFVADATGSTSIEASAHDLVLQHGTLADDAGDASDASGVRLAHTNHFLHTHDESVPHKVFLDVDESTQRLRRATVLMDDVAAKGDGLSLFSSIERILEDEDNGPDGINRAGTDAAPARTLFSIVMNLGDKTATVRFGRPSALSERLVLDPCSLK